MTTQRRPQHLCGECGRQACWQPGKVCTRCQRSKLTERQLAANTGARERERRLLRPTEAERLADRQVLQATFDRWLAKQPADHPWRVALAGGEA